MSPGLTIVSHQRWRADDLAPHTEVRLDHGLDLDAAADPDAIFWAPGGWAAAATARYPRIQLSSAGPAWLDRLPIQVTGRDITTSTASAVLAVQGRIAAGKSVFVKLPETKHELFEARVRTAEELTQDLRVLPPDEPVQLQDPVTFEYEIRCWVRDRQVVAHAAYHPNAAREDWARLDDSAHSAVAAAWLSRVIGVGLLPLPDAVVIDVGWLANPVDGPPGWRIIEANAPWSSDWYAAVRMPAVIETIRASQRDVPPRWQWTPSPLLVRQSAGLLRR